MKKILIAIAAFAVVAAALATAGFVYAQSNTPPTPNSEWGMMGGGRGMRGGMMQRGSASVDMDGPMHDAMIAALSVKLGISVTDLEARLTKGETMAQIATTAGLTSEQFSALMSDAHAQALAAAVKAGTLTQAQADQMNQRGGGMMGGGRGMHAGQNGTFDCPMLDGDAQ